LWEIAKSVCFFKPRILLLPFSVATKKLAHDHHKAPQSVGPLKLVKVLLCSWHSREAWRTLSTCFANSQIPPPDRCWKVLDWKKAAMYPVLVWYIGQHFAKYRLSILVYKDPDHAGTTWGNTGSLVTVCLVGTSWGSSTLLLRVLIMVYSHLMLSWC
jgi:hypothetical protein